MAVGVVDEDHDVLHRSSGRDGRPRARAAPRRLARASCRQGSTPARSVEAIGLGVPCTIDRERGVAISAVNLPIVDVPIRDLIAERLGLPVYLDNDANVAVLAEHRFGAARGATNALMLTIGTGIGGGLIINGERLPRLDGRRRRARPRRHRPGRAALPGQLPKPRLRRGARLGHRARARGPAGGADATRTRRSARRLPPARRSTASASPRRRSRATGSRARS